MTTHSKSLLSNRSATPVERVLERDAQPGLDQHALELASDRLGALAHDRVDRLGERQAGGERARHQLEGVGQRGVERLAAARLAGSRGRPTGRRRRGRGRRRPRTRLPPPRAARAAPATMKMPTCSSSHSAGFNVAAGPSSRWAIRASRPALRSQHLARRRAVAWPSGLGSSWSASCVCPTRPRCTSATRSSARQRLALRRAPACSSTISSRGRRTPTPAYIIQAGRARPLAGRSKTAATGARRAGSAIGGERRRP